MKAFCRKSGPKPLYDYMVNIEADDQHLMMVSELLEALKKAEAFLDLTPTEMIDCEAQGQEAWEAVTKAIAKAEGRI